MVKIKSQMNILSFWEFLKTPFKLLRLGIIYIIRIVLIAI